MLDWTTYLNAVCNSPRETPWRNCFISVDVEGNKLAKRGFLLTLKVETVTDKEQEKERFSVLEGLRKYQLNHVVLEGRPGSGKTTALKRLLLEIAQQKNELDKIPVFVPLRDYKTSILDLIVNGITDYLPKNLTPPTPLPYKGKGEHYSPLLVGEGLGERSTILEEIKGYLSEGKLLLLFDGINELPSDNARKELQEFRQQYKNNPMIFTTRQLGLGGDLDIEKKLTMLPLTEPQMREFIRAYLPGKKAEEMLKRLGERLQKFGETPLLLLMLCSVFNENDKIPNNLGETFRAFTHIYDNQLKENVPTRAQSQTLWNRSLKYLAFQMTKRRDEPVISRREAEDLLQEFLEKEKEKHCSESLAINWLKDLLSHHLLQWSSGDNIEFRHQMIQEYYAGEYLLGEVKRLTDEGLKWGYLNYLKWTESVALMLGLSDEQSLGERVVKLAIDVNLQLAARLAGEVKREFQKQTVKLVLELNIPQLYKVYLLGRTKSEEAVTELINALQHPDEEVRRRAAESLGNIGSERAIDSLIKALKDPDHGVRWSAAESIGNIGSEWAIASLIKALEHPDHGVRRSAAQSLGLIGAERAIASLIKALEQPNEDHLRVAESIGLIGSERSINSLIRALEDPDDGVRRSAAESLGTIGSERAIDSLIKALEDSDDGVRTKAAKSLGNIGSERVIDSLIKALEHPDDGVRKRAAESLGNIRSGRVIDSLIKALKHPNDRVRRSAAESLGNIGSGRAIDSLIKALEDPDDGVRWSAAESLGNIGSERAIDSLIKALEDSYNYVRRRAADSLGKIGAERAIYGLIKALEDPDYDVRKSVAESLEKIGSERLIYQLNKILLNENFKNYNNICIQLIESLEKTQDKLKIYQPINPMNNTEIFISYAWESADGYGKASEDMANQLEQAFKDKGYTIIRDKKDLGYKGNIKEFMERIGRGKCVLTVISDKYLKSENCMFELVEIARNGYFYDRIFPVVLPDAKIYKAIDRDDYIDYWDGRIEELNEKLKSRSGSLGKRQSIFDELNLYDDIRRNIDQLTDILKNMNTLTPTIHTESEFIAIIEAVENKLKNDLSADERR